MAWNQKAAELSYQLPWETKFSKQSTWDTRERTSVFFQLENQLLGLVSPLVLDRWWRTVTFVTSTSQLNPTTHYAARPSNLAMGETWHQHLQMQWKEVFDGRRLLLTIPCGKTPTWHDQPYRVQPLHKHPGRLWPTSQSHHWLCIPVRNALVNWNPHPRPQG